MAIHDETRRRLWARSGNLCAICRTLLVREDADGERGALIGQEAHIIARSPGGPRYEPLEVTRRDSYDNLVLLCANDHREVDTQPERYPVARLQDIKRAHERWVAQRLTAEGHSTDPGEAWAYASMMATGDDVWSILQGSLAYVLNAPSDLTADEEDLVDRVLQECRDWGEIWPDVTDQGLRHVRDAKRSIRQAITDLTDAGFVLLGGATDMPIVDGSLTGRVAFFEVRRPDELDHGPWTASGPEGDFDRP